MVSANIFERIIRAKENYQIERISCMISHLGMTELSFESDKIFFDPQNPRFFFKDLKWETVEGRYNCDSEEEKLEAQEEVFSINQERIRRHMLEKHGLDLLINSILQLGFIPMDNILVRKSGDKFIVVEGNRRVAAVKTILHYHRCNLEDVADHVLQSIEDIKVFVLPEGKEHDESALIYQGIRHISGTRSWAPYQQGKLAAKLAKSRSMQDVGQILGLSGGRVAKLARGYYGLKQLLEDAEYGEKASANMFSYFEQAHTQIPVREWLGWDDEICQYTNMANLHFFYKCIFSSTDNDSFLAKDVRDILPTVLKSEEATKLFINTGNVKRAHQLIQNEFKLPKKSVQTITDQLQKVDITKLASNDLEELKQLHKLLGNFLAA
jgi:hypothetical protein